MAQTKRQKKRERLAQGLDAFSKKLGVKNLDTAELRATNRRIEKSKRRQFQRGS